MPVDSSIATTLFLMAKARGEGGGGGRKKKSISSLQKKRALSSLWRILCMVSHFSYQSAQCLHKVDNINIYRDLFSKLKNNCFLFFNEFILTVVIWRFCRRKKWSSEKVNNLYNSPLLFMILLSMVVVTHGQTSVWNIKWKIQK